MSLWWRQWRQQQDDAERAHTGPKVELAPEPGVLLRVTGTEEELDSDEFWAGLTGRPQHPEPNWDEIFDANRHEGSGS